MSDADTIYRDLIAELLEPNPYHWGDTAQMIQAFKNVAERTGREPLTIQKIRQIFTSSRCTFCRKTLDIPVEGRTTRSHSGGSVLPCQHILCKACFEFHQAQAITQGVNHGEVMVVCSWAGEDGTKPVCGTRMFYNCNHLQDRPAVPPLNTTGDARQWVDEKWLISPGMTMLDDCPRCSLRALLDEWTLDARKKKPELGRVWACCSGVRGLVKEGDTDEPVKLVPELSAEAEANSVYLAVWWSYAFLDGEEFDDKVMFITTVK
jgi:hypothetical protein